jgi:UDP-N-acetylmuramate dehydrogenase
MPTTFIPNTFNLPVRCQREIIVSQYSDLELLNEVVQAGQYLVVGKGSNILFKEDYLGTIIRNGFTLLEVADDGKVWAGGGLDWSAFVWSLLKRNLWGLENLVEIPGTVGAAPVQNIGAYGVEVSDFIDLVEAYDLGENKVLLFDKETCDFQYRHSMFKSMRGRYLILRVRFSLKTPESWMPKLSYKGLGALSSDDKVLSAISVATEIKNLRQRKLPDYRQLPNAGSFFKNPIVPKELIASSNYLDQAPSFPVNDSQTKLSAGWLIEQAGLKGVCVGGACVSDKHALVLINQGSASGSDIYQLMEIVQSRVKNRFGVMLTPEVNIIDRNGYIN